MMTVALFLRVHTRGVDSFAQCTLHAMEKRSSDVSPAGYRTRPGCSMCLHDASFFCCGDARDEILPGKTRREVSRSGTMTD
jgi:hypothetical protein